MLKQTLFLSLLLTSMQPLVAQDSSTFLSDTKPLIKGKIIGYNAEKMLN